MSGLVRQAATVLLGRGMIRAAQFVAFIILARLLSPTDFGWFGILTTAFALAGTLGSLGLRQSFAFDIGQGRLTPGQAVGTSIVLWPIVTAISATVIFLLYGHQINGLPASILLVVIVLGVAGTILHTLMQGVFLGRGTIWAFSLSETLPRVMFMLGVVVLALTGSVTLTNAMWAHVGSFMLALVLIVYLAQGRGHQIGIALRRMRSMLGYGLIFAFNLFLVTLCSRLSMFIIEAFSGAAAAGQFFAAVRINEIFLEAAAALGMVLFSRAARTDDKSRAIANGVRAASWMFWFFLALAIVVILFAPIVVVLLLGPAYMDSVPALQILAVGMAPMAASRMIYPAIAGTGRPHFGTPVILISLGINAVVALLLIPALGVSGGAISVVAGQYVLLVGYAITCRARFGLALHALFVPRWRDFTELWRGAVSRARRRTRKSEGTLDDDGTQ